MINVATAQAALPSEFGSLSEENTFLRHENKNLRHDVNYLWELVRHLERMRFAPSSEIVSPGQGTLFNEAELIAEEEALESPASDKKSKKKKRGRPVRKPLPESLPREEKIVDLAEEDKVCPKSGVALKRIGEEQSEQLDIEPMKAKVIVTTRLKYACDCEACKSGIEAPTIITAPVDPQPIPKSMAAPGLLAHIAVAKFSDALPLARQETIFSRHGIDIHRSSMASWMIRLGEMVMPLINLTRDELLRLNLLQADETRIQVHKGTGKKPSAQSYMWVFLGEASNGSKLVLYELGPSRSHLVPMRVLEGFKGYLHTDGFEAYETLAQKMPGIKLVGDWAHVRRKFDEALKAVAKDHKGKVKAQKGFELINELFRIDREDIGSEAGLAKRHSIRQEKSRPVALELKTWADSIIATIPPKSLTGKALNYMLDRWPKLVLFLEDPTLRLDTNPVEGVIRPFVVGRNNWMFADTKKGAEASAALYSLIVMAKAANKNPFDYLKMIFTLLPKARSIEDIEKLLPWV